MSETETSTLKKFAEFIRNRATHMRYAAGMNGSHTDGGASSLEESVEIFLAGINKQIPKPWKDEWETFVGSEYQEYLKLQDKYGPIERGKSR